MDDTTTVDTAAPEVADTADAAEVSQETAAPETSEERAERKMREIAEEEYEQYQTAAKFTEDLFTRLEKDPKSVMSRLMLVNPALANAMEEMLAERYLKQVEEESLTPEERKQRELEAELKRYKDAEAMSAKQAEELAVRQEQERLENIMLEGMKLSGMPADPLLAEFARRGIEVGMKAGVDVTPEMLADYVTSKMTALYGGHIDRLEGDALLDAIGSKTLQRVKAALLAKSGGAKGTFTTPPKSQEADKPKRPKTTAQLLREANGTFKSPSAPVEKSKPKTLQQLLRETSKLKE